MERPVSAPSIGRIVHYMARGSLDRKFPPVCRAAMVSEVDPDDATRIGLVALNPTGLFFHSLADGGCLYNDGAEQPGTQTCPDREAHGNPFRYCACGWREAGFPGGTWHWPERV